MYLAIAIAFYPSSKSSGKKQVEKPPVPALHKFLIPMAMPPDGILKAPLCRLHGDEEALVRGAEAKAKVKGPLTRKEEASLFGIYSKLSKRAAMLEEALASGEANGESGHLRLELAAVNGIMDRIANAAILSNYRYVCKTVREISGRRIARSMKFDDLVGEAIIAMKESAVPGFDHTRGFRFTTYATAWIRQAVGRSIDDRDRMVRVPVNTCDAQKKVGAFVRKYREAAGSAPGVGEISAGTGLKPERVRKVLALKPDGATAELDVRLPDGRFPRQDERLAGEEMKTALARLVETLKPREKEIVERRFGLNGYGGEGQTLEEVGRAIGLTRERVRQIEKIALGKLRERAVPAGLADCI